MSFMRQSGAMALGMALRAVRRRGGAGTPLAAAITVWICVMALVGVVTVAAFGWKVVLVAGAVMFAVCLAACWLLCMPYERARAEWESAVREAARRRATSEGWVVDAAVRACRSTKVR